MLKNRSSRFVFALIVVALLFVVGRNVYRRILNNRLIAAVEAKNVAAVRALLARGADPNSRQPSNERSVKATPALGLVMMKWATGTSRDDEAIACLLIQHGANVFDEYSNNYLDQACYCGSLAVVQALLEHGASPNLSGESKRIPLDSAISYAMGRAKQKRVGQEMVRQLQEHGARLNLWQAACIDDVDALRALLNAGTPVDARDPSSNINNNAGKTGKGPTALTMAAYAGSLAAVRFLLERGANINARCDDSYRYSPLAGAITRGQLETARFLLHSGANVNMLVVGFDTPLQHTCTHLPPLVPDMLLQGADLKTQGDAALSAAIRTKNSALFTLLMQHMQRRGVKPGADTLQAAFERQPDLVSALMAQGVVVHETPRQHRDSLLWYALHSRRKELIMPLLRAGANINAHFNTSPLMEAIGQEAATVKLLLEQGADPNLVVGGGQTPLLAATQAGNVEMVRLLLKHGANVNQVSTQRHTPLYFARRHHHPEVVALLQQAGGKEE